ncbi:hypothetical protein EJB05_49044 [Eragrostis curvula]|uniref:Uncharacterized protein n=1 Tax=Eragrostis curvula TaxID=38414 RepID=A0A5J9T3A0_9POAL|nr:hypothetical protein EJB05_49044 [Eragrostis curvula]
MAVADDAVVVVVVVSAPPPPEPEPAPAPCRLATALDCLLLASFWVIYASTGALTVAGRVSGTDSPAYQALVRTSVGAYLLLALAVVAWCLYELATGLRLLKAAVAVVKNKKKVSFWKVLAASIREKDTFLLGWLASALFYLLAVIGVVMTEVVPRGKCHRIGAALFDLGIPVVAAIFCFILVPIIALKFAKNKDWRNSIVISEAKTIKEDVRYQHEAHVSDLKFPNI